MLARFVLLSLCLSLAACPSKPPPPPPVDAECDQACKRLEQMQCDIAKPTPAGATCTQWCLKYATRDRKEGLDIDCFSRAPTCEAANRCTY